MLFIWVCLHQTILDKQVLSSATTTLLMSRRGPKICEELGTNLGPLDPQAAALTTRLDLDLIRTVKDSSMAGPRTADCSDGKN